MENKDMNVIRRFNRIEDKINSLYHKASRIMGFADSEMMILYLLCDYGTIAQKDVIAFAGMSKQTVSSAVSRMEQAGWLKRGSEAGHKRDIVPTEKGRAIIEEVIRPFMAEEEAIVESWPEEEQQEFLRLHQKYCDGLQAAVNQMESRGKTE